MDILNWLYLQKAKLIKTKANDASLDLVALGADATFINRGDKYKTYAMTLADAVASGCTENNTYKTGIFDLFPWAITPSMLKTCTRVEDTPAFPTALAVNLQGYKVGGSITLNGSSSYSEYIGSVEIPNTGVPIFLSYKTTGSVTASLGGDLITNPLGLFNSVTDTFGLGSISYGQIVIAAMPYTTLTVDGYDLVMYVDPTSIQPILGNIEAQITFEFEFLIDETLTPLFTIY